MANALHDMQKVEHLQTNNYKDGRTKNEIQFNVNGWTSSNNNMKILRTIMSERKVYIFHLEMSNKN